MVKYDTKWNHEVEITQFQTKLMWFRCCMNCVMCVQVLHHGLSGKKRVKPSWYWINSHEPTNLRNLSEKDEMVSFGLFTVPERIGNTPRILI